jgi:hypothetical protein
MTPSIPTSPIIPVAAPAAAAAPAAPIVPAPIADQRVFGNGIAAIKERDDTEYKTLERMNVGCPYCGALHWIEVFMLVVFYFLRVESRLVACHVLKSELKERSSCLGLGLGSQKHGIFMLILIQPFPL